MEEQLISFETAKLAREKGFTFNSTCYYQLLKDGQLRYKLVTEDDEDGSWVNADFENRIAACTQSLLQKWLREEHYIHINIHLITLSKWQFTVSVYKEIDAHYSKRGVATKEFFKTYEEALEEGLFRALKLLKGE